jgi:predicted alpha/beta superfamily hydrolase
MPKKKLRKKTMKDEPPQVLGRLGAEQWIAVRQKSGAGPMEPKPRRGTRTQREREAIEREAGGAAEKDV